MKGVGMEVDKTQVRHILHVKTLRAQIESLEDQMAILGSERRRLLDELAELEHVILNPALVELCERKAVLERRVRIAEAYAARLSNESSSHHRVHIREMFWAWSGEDDPSLLLERSRHQLEEIVRQVNAFEDEA